MRILFVTHHDVKTMTGAGVYSHSVRSLFAVAFAPFILDIVYAVAHDTPLRKRVRKVGSVLAAMGRTHSIKSFYFRTATARCKIKTLCSQHRYDLCLIEHAEMLWVLDILPKGLPCIHVSQNVEHQVYKQFINTLSPLLRRLLSKDAVLYRDDELKGIGRCHGVISISHRDAEEFKALAPQTPCSVVPPLFTYTPYCYKARQCSPIRLGCLANLVWWPNRRGLDWFIEKVLPQVNVPCELHVYGRGAESMRDVHPLVHIHGFVESLTQIWDESDLMISPVFDGGGVNVKVAEAIYNRMPVLCSSFSLRGLPPLKQVEPFLMVGDEPGWWARKINELVSDKVVLIRQPESNALRFAQSDYVVGLQDFVGTVLAGTDPGLIVTKTN